MVGLDELSFVPVSDGTTAVNLYRSGAVATMPGFNFPPLFTTVLGRKKDFHAEPCFGTVAATINAQRPPLDNVLLRYALNMATEKRPFTAFSEPDGFPHRPWFHPCRVTFDRGLLT